MIAYSLGLSLAPAFVGFLLALGVIRYAFKMKLVRQLKIISYLAAVVLTTVIHVEFSPLSDSANVVAGTCFGFIIPVVITFLLKANSNSKSK